MKPFLILQLREIDEVADNEFEAFLRYGGLKVAETHRIRMEKESFAGIDASQYCGVIVGGGPSNVSDDPKDKPDYQKRFEAELHALFKQIFSLDIPYMGSCYGLGAVVNHAGGKVSKENYYENVGLTTVRLREEAFQDPLLQGLPSTFQAFVGHKEACQTVSNGGRILAGSAACPVQMVRFQQNIYATQFHTELDKDGLIMRIQHYRHHGYFEPELAEALIKEVKTAQAEIPQEILRRFVEKYKE